MINKWDKRFLQLAQTVSNWSKDPSTKCGAVITRGNRIVSIGFNGFPNKCSDHDHFYNDRIKKYNRVIHAEVNAILFAKQDLSDCSIYVYPIQPCSNCMALIIQSGISKVFTLFPDEDKAKRWSDSFEESNQLAEESNTQIIRFKKELLCD